MAVFCDRSLSLVADDEDARVGFDDVVGDGFELVDFEDAGDLREQALQESVVAAGDAFETRLFETPSALPLIVDTRSPAE